MALNNKKIILWLCLSVSCFLSTSISAKKFIIGVEDLNYYPLFNFSSSSTSFPNSSFTKDLLTTFFTKYNYQFQFLALPNKRFDKWYAEENIDFKFPDNFRWRDDKAHKLNLIFSRPVLSLMAGAYVLKSKNLASNESIKSLVTILGFYPTFWVDKIKNKQLQLLEETSPLSIVKHILYGNADATNIDINVIRYNLKFLHKKDVIVLNTNAKHEVYTYHLSSIRYPEVIGEFNLFLQENKQYIQQLKVKYNTQESF